MSLLGIGIRADGASIGILHLSPITEHPYTGLGPLILGPDWVILLRHLQFFSFRNGIPA
jgi:hypothetical protein